MKSDNLYAPREVEHDPPASFTKTLISICEYTICKQNTNYGNKNAIKFTYCSVILDVHYQSGSSRDNKKHEELNALMSVFTFQH